MAHEEHEHEHGHGHGHEQGHDRGTVLERGAGAAKVLFLDAPSGLAGDMIVAALVDLGVPREVVADALAELPVTGFHVHFGTRVRSGIVATSFEVHVDRLQPLRTYAAIRAMLDESGLPEGVRARAHRTFRHLAVAEAKVHRTPIDQVHFHEVGAVDAIADVVGSAAALDHLRADLVVSPLPMGRGMVTAAHGKLPLPPPATVECLVGLETYDGGIDFELVTPTGAAIVGAHAIGSQRWPSMRPERIGWGAGSAELADRPNVLRAVLGATIAQTAGHARATHAVLEVNVDDATGELVASWIESLLAAGAVDVWATPITMKKGRPALTLSALAPLALADVVEHSMLRETTSLGVRRHDVVRAERPRRIVQVGTPYGAIPVKVAEGPFGPAQAKPEFEACAAAARAHGVPVREVLRATMSAWGKQEVDASLTGSWRTETR
ncbi:MAG TPA: nickel pincer cofactor biosynthesis protein LarC [Polyangiaceae bacterium]|nr:nickel pincer cofactor biosynthesis protein LarC [Polyangiaceae bacterium]